MAETSSFRRDLHGAGEAISLSEVISALSYALELTEGSVRGHAPRSCMVGMRIGREIGLGAAEMDSLYYALLLKDVAGNNFEGMDLAQASLRCSRGASIMRKLGMNELAAEAVRCVEERWDGGGIPDRLRGEQIPLLARICAVARYLDIVASDGGVQRAMNALAERSGTWFDPALVRVAKSLDARGALWVNCFWGDEQDEMVRVVAELDPGLRAYLEAAEIDRVCEAFADVVDAKSHFTFSHSMGVADAARGIAERVGLRADRVQLVRRAALLHDIGKLSVSNRILDKVGGLNAQEWRAVRRHPGYTRRILEHVGPFREIAVIAGQHHEKLDGTGYPNRMMGRELSMEARIVAVADIYGALSEDRPYRAGLEFEQIVPIMKELAPKKLDRDCVEALVDVVASHRKPVFAQAAAPLIYAAV